MMVVSGPAGLEAAGLLPKQQQVRLGPKALAPLGRGEGAPADDGALLSQRRPLP